MKGVKNIANESVVPLTEGLTIGKDCPIFWGCSCVLDHTWGICLYPRCERNHRNIFWNQTLVGGMKVPLSCGVVLNQIYHHNLIIAKESGIMTDSSSLDLRSDL